MLDIFYLGYMIGQNMISFVSIIHALACIFIVIFILLQDPKGGVLGSLGGSGGSRSFFGSEGASPFLVTVTKWLAILFACSSFYLSYMSSKRGSVMDDLSENPPISSTQNPSGNADKKTSSSENQTNSSKDKADVNNSVPFPKDTNSKNSSSNKAKDKAENTADKNTPNSSKNNSQPASPSENK